MSAVMARNAAPVPRATRLAGAKRLAPLSAHDPNRNRPRRNQDGGRGLGPEGACGCAAARRRRPATPARLAWSASWWRRRSASWAVRGGDGRGRHPRQPFAHDRAGARGEQHLVERRPAGPDLAARLGRPVRIANDANCLALSEAADGAGAGFGTVFAAILGTGTGAGVVVGGRLVGGPQPHRRRVGPQPSPLDGRGEHPGPACWCGRRGCIETFLCGPALAADADGPGARDAEALPARAAAGDARATAALRRHAGPAGAGAGACRQPARPDCIVLGGGLSNMAHLYEEVPRLLPRWVFSDAVTTPLLRARHGDSSGVLGAARLWDAP